MYIHVQLWWLQLSKCYEFHLHLLLFISCRIRCICMCNCGLFIDLVVVKCCIEFSSMVYIIDLHYHLDCIGLYGLWDPFCHPHPLLVGLRVLIWLFHNSHGILIGCLLGWNGKSCFLFQLLCLFVFEFDVIKKC